MKLSFLATILFLFPFSAHAGFPEGVNGYDLKKIEYSFRLPCKEIGNDACIARALGVGACAWIFGLNNDKEPGEALKIADAVFIIYFAFLSLISLLISNPITTTHMFIRNTSNGI